jgi:hypothetical protein
MKKYLICLEGGGDVDRFIVGEATWNWINQDPPDFGLAYATDETVSPEVRAEAADQSAVPETVRVTSGSYDNDRAIHASCWSKSVKTGRGTFEDVYNGAIY